MTFPLVRFSKRLFDLKGCHRINCAIVDFLVNDYDKPTVRRVTRHDWPSGAATDFPFQRIADYRFNVLCRKTMFRNVLQVATWIVVPDNVEPGHGDSPASIPCRPL